VALRHQLWLVLPLSQLNFLNGEARVNSGMYLPQLSASQWNAMSASVHKETF
jgi:hypothetical protein